MANKMDIKFKQLTAEQMVSIYKYILSNDDFSVLMHDWE